MITTCYCRHLCGTSSSCRETDVICSKKFLVHSLLTISPAYTAPSKHPCIISILHIADQVSSAPPITEKMPNPQPTSLLAKMSNLGPPWSTCSPRKTHLWPVLQFVCFFWKWSSHYLWTALQESHDITPCGSNDPRVAIVFLTAALVWCWWLTYNYRIPGTDKPMHL